MYGYVIRRLLATIPVMMVVGVVVFLFFKELNALCFDECVNESGKVSSLERKISVAANDARR